MLAAEVAPIEQAQAIQYARRRLATTSLPDFACMVDIPTVPLTDAADEDAFSVLRIDRLAAHHLLLCQALQRVDAGEIPNLMVLMPPGSAKSSYTDVVFIPWFMARKARRHVILASYASDIAVKQGRRARQLINSRAFFNLTGRTLRGDNRAADQWTLDNGSEFMAGGLLSGLTGNRAALGVIDDPIRGREAAQSETIRAKTWDAYTDDFCSRLLPGAPQVMILCMVGGTPVLMADGTEKPLRDIRAGDSIATYADGRLEVSTVRNWACQGTDSVIRIRTKSGKIVEANERHPFLVERNGEKAWRRTRELQVGDRMLRAERGSACCAQSKDAACPCPARACACRTTTSTSGHLDTGRRRSTKRPDTRQRSSTATGCASASTGPSLSARAASAPSASSRLPQTTCGRIGAESCASTTTTKPEGSGRCCATTAICSSDTQSARKRCCAPLSTYEITLDEIADISAAGAQDVFDIQVERTENFIANGFVSHNTRWHEDDPAGRILPEGWDGESGWFDGRDGRRWYVICLPAEADSADDPLGRKIGESLWPEWFKPGHWEPFKLLPMTWASLYQQKPKPRDGAVIKPDMMPVVDALAAGPVEWVRAWDLAASTDGDYTAGALLGKMRDGRFVIADVVRLRAGPDERDAAIRNTAARDGRGVRVGLPQDPGQAGKTQVLHLTRMLAGYSVRTSPETGDKLTRAEPLAAQINVGNVLLLRGPWNQTLIDEMRMFPNGRHDDQVDALSRAFGELLLTVSMDARTFNLPGL